MYGITQLPTFVRLVGDAGATLPTPVADAIEHARTIDARAAALGESDTALGDAVYAALEAGRDPAADKAVTRLLNLRQIPAETSIGIARTRNDATIRATLTDHAAEAVERLSTAFDEAAGELETAQATLGADVPLDHAKVADGAASQEWLTAVRGLGRINAAVAAWATLGELTGYDVGNPTYWVLRFCAASLDEWEANRLAGSRATAWELLGLGIRLSLPGPDGLAPRIAAINTAWDDRAAEAQEVHLKGIDHVLKAKRAKADALLSARG